VYGDWFLDGTKTPGFYDPSFEVGGNLGAGQYCNDPIDDEMVNFRLRVATDDKGKLLPYLDYVCNFPSKNGDELLLGYRTEYWMKQTNWCKLSRASRIDMSQNYKKAWKRNSTLYNLKIDQ